MNFSQLGIVPPAQTTDLFTSGVGNPEQVYSSSNQAPTSQAPTTPHSLHTAPESLDVQLLNLLAPVVKATFAEYHSEVPSVSNLSELTSPSLLTTLDRLSTHDTWGVQPSARYVQGLTRSLLAIAEHTDNSSALTQAALRALSNLLKKLTNDCTQSALSEIISHISPNIYLTQATPDKLSKSLEVSSQVMQILQSVAKSNPVLVTKALYESNMYSYRGSSNFEVFNTVLPIALKANPQDVSTELMLAISKHAPANNSSKQSAEQALRQLNNLQSLIAQSGVQNQQLNTVISRVQKECSTKLDSPQAMVQPTAQAQAPSQPQATPSYGLAA